MGGWFSIWDTPGKSGRVGHVYVFLVLKMCLQKSSGSSILYFGYSFHRVYHEQNFQGINKSWINQPLLLAESQFVRDPRVIRVAKGGIYQA